MYMIIYDGLATVHDRLLVGAEAMEYLLLV